MILHSRKAITKQNLDTSVYQGGEVLTQNETDIKLFKIVRFVTTYKIQRNFYEYLM